MAIDTETLQAALIGCQSEQEAVARAIADLQAKLKGARASAGTDGNRAAATRPRRQISAAARRRIAAAQKKRWAEYHKAQKAGA